MSRAGRIAWGASLALLACGLVFSIGPRNGEIAWEPAPTNPVQLPEQLEALEAQLAASEARVGGLTPQTEKRIVWGEKGRQRAPWAVVYLHGFSATRQEMAPVPERLAQALGGNTFYTRLAGHGLPGEAMAQASLGQWKADALEALQVGQRIGERVLVVGASTGATLAAWLAQREEAKDVAGWVLVSPNFGPRDPLAGVINWPWGRSIARLVQGAEYQEAPANERKARFWTHRYPTEALFPMMALVERVRGSELGKIQAPTLMMMSPRDTVIDVAEARAAFERIGSPRKQLIEVDYSESPGQHVLAGDIDAPRAVQPMVDQIRDFVATQVEPRP
ncbi:alpha/beta hydrolase [Roseateles sp. DB2]|uniref:alpha/beta hydrolase n=1 Tax=Roseateles sp. DB2 TaxID=3453717 RepID=UPI003EEB585E